MAQNIFQFELSHSSGNQIISEPDGWAGVKITLERDREYFSLVEFIETPFIFYGSNGVHDGGMNYILNVKANFGVDSQITIFIRISRNDGIYFETLFTGLIDMQSVKTIDSRKLEAVITRNDLWAKFWNRRDTPVNIQSTVDLYDNPLTPISNVELNLISQPILSKYHSYEKIGVYLVGIGVFNNPLFVQFQPDTIVLDEISDTFNIGTDFSEALPVWIHEFEYGGDAVFDIRYEISRTQGDGFHTPRDPIFSPTQEWRVYFKLNDLDPVQFTESDAVYVDPSVYTTWNPATPAYISGTDVGTMIATFNSTVPIKAGDIVRVFVWRDGGAGAGGSLVFWGSEGQPASTLSTTVGPCARPAGMVALPTYYRVTQNTVYDETQAESFFAHDVGFEITKRIVADNSFHSDYLGSTQTISKVYDEDGCGWPFILVRGLQLRQYLLTDKPFSISFKQWWDGLNPIHNLGLGYDIVDSVEVIRVEEKAFFFNDTPIIYFDWVNNILESYDKDFIFNKVKIGYKKWQSEDISGIDDPQTKHNYATLFKTAGQEMPIESDFIAASLAVETTRRKTKEKSADYKFDDDTFIIAINPNLDSSPVGYNPELDENFNSVSGLLNSNSRYNLSLTPLRNLIRWFNVLSGCLQDYTTSAFKFTGGEGNYDMVSDYNGAAPGICFNKIADPLSEKQDLIMSYNGLLGHLFRPEILEFKYPLSWENYKLIRDNRTRAIAISETDSDHTICHIKKLEYDVINSLGTFTVWRK